MQPYAHLCCLAAHGTMSSPACSPPSHTQYCSLGKDEEEGGGLHSVNAWFGPGGTVTPLHTDPHHNLLCQVVGRKYVRLYAPSQTPAMYPYEEGLTTNSSQVDLRDVDEEKWVGEGCSSMVRLHGT